MCSRKYSRGLPVLLLQLLLFTIASPLYSGQTEILEECMTRLEITTNELESARDLLIEQESLTARQTGLVEAYRILTREQMRSLNERDEQFKAIESSLRDTEKSVKGSIRRAYIIGGASGLIVGVLVSVLLTR